MDANETSQKLFAENQKTAGYFAWKYSIPGYDYDDNLQVALLALHRASLSFETGKQSFPTYASIFIKNALNNAWDFQKKRLYPESNGEGLENVPQEEIGGKIDGDELARIGEVLKSLPEKEKKVVGLMASKSSITDVAKSLGCCRIIARRRCLAAETALKSRLRAAGIDCPAGVLVTALARLA